MICGGLVFYIIQLDPKEPLEKEDAVISTNNEMEQKEQQNETIEAIAPANDRGIVLQCDLSGVGTDGEYVTATTFVNQLSLQGKDQGNGTIEYPALISHKASSTGVKGKPDISKSIARLRTDISIEDGRVFIHLEKPSNGREYITIDRYTGDFQYVGLNVGPFSSYNGQCKSIQRDNLPRNLLGINKF